MTKIIVFSIFICVLVVILIILLGLDGREDGKENDNDTEDDSLLGLLKSRRDSDSRCFQRKHEYLTHKNKKQGG